MSKIIKIAITGGKGGTGKSTLSTSLASALARDKKVLLIDADVDCPGDDLLLSIKLKKAKDVKNMMPVFDFKKCLRCGKCATVCPEKAIVFVKGKNPVFIPEQCIGCRACKLVCPTKAITESEQIIGEIFIGQKDNLTLLSGKMKTGIEESSLVVNAVKKFYFKQEKDFDYIIIDTAAGTHCPVIAAISGVDQSLAVTEPTPLGAHDLNLILSLTKRLKIKTQIVINRSNIGSKSVIEKIAQKNKVKIIAEIPYSQEIEKKYCTGQPIENKEIEKIINQLKK
ncbi:MAG TPA: ATP-binding protein [Patescibacteria group bacterium]|nr:ATP-binding protein [Patescibacteria group bacterium]